MGSGWPLAALLPPEASHGREWSKAERRDRLSKSQPLSGPQLPISSAPRLRGMGGDQKVLFSRAGLSGVLGGTIMGCLRLIQIPIFQEKNNNKKPVPEVSWCSYEPARLNPWKQSLSQWRERCPPLHCPHGHCHVA